MLGISVLVLERNAKLLCQIADNQRTLFKQFFEKK
jgi:hypothetical protein